MISGQPQYPPVEFTLFERLNSGVLILDYESRSIRFTNTHFKLIAGDNEPLIIENILSYLDSRKPLSVRNDMQINADRTFGYTIYNLQDNEYLIFLGDISNRKVYFECEEENHFYDWLAGLMSELVHEIGNPLTSVNTTLQVLDENIGNWNTTKSKEYIERACNEIARLSKYLNKLRDFSMVNHLIDKQPVYLKQLLDRLLHQTEPLLELKAIIVVCQVDPQIKILVDEGILYQVLLNLIQNSMDVQPQGGSISIHVAEQNEYFVKLVFKNNGPPIPRDLLEKIFMPFYSTKRESCGIGLAVSLKLMRRMGGKIYAEIPENGEGAQFILYIPVCP